MKKIMLLGLFLVLLQSFSVLAYLDPGSGSMLLQILIGGIAAAGIVVRAKWYKIKTYFSKGKQI